MPRDSKKQRLRQYLDENNIVAVSETEWRGLMQLLSPISEDYLRHLLHETGLPVAQPFDGVRQGSFEQLEASLNAMERAYSQALERGDPDRARRCRNIVIAAKDRARYQSRKKPEKEEMVLWMRVWLENPAVFPAWVVLRKRAAAL